MLLAQNGGGLPDAAASPLPGLSLVTCIIPVETGRASQMIREALDEVCPDDLVCLGEAGRPSICLEQVGYNERRFVIPDNAGNMVEGQPVQPGAPPAYGSTLPLARMLEAMQATGVSTRLSDDPGRYLCNEVLFSALHYIAEQRLSTRAGFVHVPHLPAEATEPEYPCLETAEVVRALRAGLLALAESEQARESYSPL